MKQQQWKVNEDAQKEGTGGCFIVSRKNLFMCRRFVNIFTEIIAII